ncbi:hypothetical protein [Absidia glauca]|uniref:Myb-like domain-containing protein n=1 Tax=Absidia glauca TaxID=4829 RepID=A0A168P0N3_ABSGL|nr:hypothetical protein [Absidia glauca]
MPTIIGDDLFGRLRKADEVAYALITGFIKADEFNEEQSDDLQHRKQVMFPNSVFLNIEYITTMAIELLPSHVDDTEEEVIRSWAQLALHHINLATLIRFLCSTNITQTLDFSFRHMLSDDSLPFPSVSSALVDLRTRVLTELLEGITDDDDEGVFVDQLLDKVLPQQTEKYGMESLKDADTLLDIVNKRRLKIGDLGDSQSLDNLVPNEEMVAAWKNVLLLMDSQYGTSTPPQILFPQSNTESFDISDDDEDAFGTPPEKSNNDVATQAEIMLQSMMNEQVSAEVADDVDTLAGSQLDFDNSEESDNEVNELDELSSNGSQQQDQQDAGLITNYTVDETINQSSVNLSSDQQSQPVSANEEEDDVIITNTSQSSYSSSVSMDSFPTIIQSQSQQSISRQQSTQSSYPTNPTTTHDSNDDDDYAESVLSRNRAGITLKHIFKSNRTRKRFKGPLDQETSGSLAIGWNSDGEEQDDNIGQSQAADDREAKRQRHIPSTLSTSAPSPNTLSTSAPSPPTLSTSAPSPPTLSASAPASPGTATTAAALTQAPSSSPPVGPDSASGQLQKRPPYTAPPTDAARRRHDKGPAKTYTYWTSDELAALKEGLGHFQTRNWTKILNQYSDRFHVTRTNTDLRDKARSEIKERTRRHEPLEEFVYAIRP